jgi:hypothetical protein
MQATLLSAVTVITFQFFAAGMAMAKVVAEGKPKGGYYYQKVEKKDGIIQFMCRSKKDNSLVKTSECEQAGAKQP